MYIPKPGNSQVINKNWKSTHEAFEGGSWEYIRIANIEGNLPDQIQFLTVKLKGL